MVYALILGGKKLACHTVLLYSGMKLFKIPLTRFLALKIILQVSKFLIIYRDERTLSSYFFTYMCFQETYRPVQ